MTGILRRSAEPARRKKGTTFLMVAVFGVCIYSKLVSESSLCPITGGCDRMDRLVKKQAVITGGISGIGLARAKLFHAKGSHVVIMGRGK